jgi:hypothetical protein
MWIFGPSWYVSVVSNRTNPNELLVRARLPKDLHRFLALEYPAEAFPTIWTDPSADYRYRTIVPRHKVARIAHKAVMEIFYDNFKNEASKQSSKNEESSERMSALHDVWQVMFDLQNGLHRKTHFYGKNYAALVDQGHYEDDPFDVEPSKYDFDSLHDDAWLDEEIDPYSDYQDGQSFFAAVRQGALDLFGKRSATR